MTGIVRQHRRCRAFTLIELVTVIAILGIMAVAVGGPTLSYIDSIRVRAAGSRLVGDIRYIQRLALNSGLRTWIQFDVAANNYTLYIEDGIDNPGKDNRVPLMHPLFQTTDPVQLDSGLFADVSIASADINATDELEYDGFGVPHDGNRTALTNTGTITLNGNGADSSVETRITAVSGFVERSE